MYGTMKADKVPVLMIERTRIAIAWKVEGERASVRKPAAFWEKSSAKGTG
jgi:hypothetical protein